MVSSAACPQRDGIDSRASFLTLVSRSRFQSPIWSRWISVHGEPRTARVRWSSIDRPRLDTRLDHSQNWTLSAAGNSGRAGLRRTVSMRQRSVFSIQPLARETCVVTRPRVSSRPHDDARSAQPSLTHFSRAGFERRAESLRAKANRVLLYSRTMCKQRDAHRMSLAIRRMLSAGYNTPQCELENIREEKL